MTWGALAGGTLSDTDSLEPDFCAAALTFSYTSWLDDWSFFGPARIRPTFLFADDEPPPLLAPEPDEPPESSPPQPATPRHRAITSDTPILTAHRRRIASNPLRVSGMSRSAPFLWS